MFKDSGEHGLARCVALTQEHRGHGVSTAAYYLGRVLVAQGLRVLLVDLTGRRARLNTLMAREPIKNLVLWMPPLNRPQEMRAVLDRARRETAGRADVLLLDVDAALFERAGGLAAGVDYALVVTEPTPQGQESADRVAERLSDEPPPHGRVGVVFSRVDAPGAGELPERTESRHLPILGYYPADYLLAGGDAYSLKGGDPSPPHETYLYALLRVGQKLCQIVPLVRPQHGGLAGAAEMNGQHPA
jgi:MinD-like ATPase involved in chromosome partitioning or flagellar assembly